ncbi:hypothetical protein JAAARDRAFT_214156 [Jaapia argillacea MUCL 33604]|uniref:Fungal lipase-type domain-containing protein n=1 Tax=Jaapia argillacea MUCL 33604 TaxID=933084 RepID=A0A067QKE8_9AGAM|nr:hypothetical protein JAAARDRAFT_214156 [Jaapia argillacea MUCL 33604]
MQLLLLGLAFLTAVSGFHIPVRRNVDQPISQSLFDELKWYWQYASSAYSDVCANPNGNTLVATLNNLVTDTQGYIARDDTKRELVVAIRGTTTAQDNITDYFANFTALETPGIDWSPNGTLVHLGYLTAWNSVAYQVRDTILQQLQQHPGYSLVAVGHSLGGAVAAFGAVSLNAIFSHSEVRLYTYGQPRDGNAAWAEYVNKHFGENSYRVVHTNDGIPTLIPLSTGYRHFGIEYWMKEDPPSAANTIKCDPSGEDPNCSDSIPSEGENAAHLNYFGESSHTPHCT